MRVTNSPSYRNFTNSVNDVHSRLNKSMNKVETGRAYESASDNPLAYYEGKKIDNQYQDTLSKLSLLTEVKDRLEQQELGARSIQKLLSEAKVKIESLRSDSTGNDKTTAKTIRDDLLQKQKAMVNDLNGQYQDSYVYGGNDTSTPPFKLSDDGTKITYTHQFAGDDYTTEMVMELKDKGDGVYEYEFTGTVNSDPPVPLDKDETLDAMAKAMRETGRVDIGHGSITQRDSLLDTYTGGLNLLTGLSSDAINSMTDSEARDAIEKQLNNNPISLVGQAAMAADKYVNGGDKSELSSALGRIMDTMTETEHTVSTVYSDLGNKYALLETTEDKLNIMKQSLQEQYNDKLGADPYASIMEMYSYQQSYDATLKVGSHLVSSSLFDFMG